jgi:hypothetical protein
VKTVCRHYSELGKRSPARLTLVWFGDHRKTLAQPNPYRSYLLLHSICDLI